tara:strand:- start:320 stop:424 length:105 start_codon:yes stop_codon:yes gene_type:complete
VEIGDDQVIFKKVLLDDLSNAYFYIEFKYQKYEK